MESAETRISPSAEISLPWRVWFCYGIGHVLNDICASIWFTYLLVFFHLVLEFDAVSSGLILLIGQVADAVSTPFVGIESDKNNDIWFFKYGKRKTWHLIGTVCILSSFPFIFTPCITCRDAHIYAQMIYYAAFVIIFQFGWAAVQISHLALIPELTPNDNQRTQLTSIRYSFTMASTILVYIITWISLKSGESSDGLSRIGPNDAFNFQRVAYIGLVIGLITSLIFHWGIKEDSVWSSGREKRNPKTVFQFLRELKFYQVITSRRKTVKIFSRRFATLTAAAAYVAITYMSSRLFANIAQVYIPLYIHETLLKKSENLALIPLLMYVGSILASGVVNYLNRSLGRKVAFTLGSVIGICSCIWIKFGNHIAYEIYPISILLGLSGTILIVTALGLTADLIGFDTDSGAFVYGAMSFADKLSNGAVVMTVQYIKSSSHPNFYQSVIVFVCGGAAVAGMLPLFTLKPSVKKTSSDATDETKSLL